MLRALMAADMDDIAVPRGRNHAGDGAAMLEDGVGGDCRAVQHMIDRIAGTSWRAHSSTMAAITPRDGSSGVVGTL